MKKVFTMAIIAPLFVGCAVVAEKTNFLSDTDVQRISARAIGYEPNDVVVQSRSTEGTNTYTTVKTKDGKVFSCTINGGNLLTSGMVNPPSCMRK